LLAGVIFAAIGYVFYIAVDRAILEQQIKNFKATEAQNHERKKTDETIRNADDRRKCELIGGVFSNGQCE
jgi:hypothetical protein